MMLRKTVAPFRKVLVSRLRTGDLKLIVTGTKGKWDLAAIRGKSAFLLRSGFTTQNKAKGFSRARYMRDATVSRTPLAMA